MSDTVAAYEWLSAFLRERGNELSSLGVRRLFNALLYLEQCADGEMRLKR